MILTLRMRSVNNSQDHLKFTKILYYLCEIVANFQVKSIEGKIAKWRILTPKYLQENH